MVESFRGGPQLRERLRAHGAHLVVLAMWIVGIGAISAVLLLQDRLDARREAQLVVADMRNHAEQAPSVPFQALDGHGTPADARAALAKHAEGFRRATERLWRLDPGTRVQRIEATGQLYFHTIARVIDLVAAGRLEEAGFAAATISDEQGLLGELRELLAEQRADARAEAINARRLSEVGSALVVLLTLAAFSLALIRATRLRREAESLALANTVLLSHSLDEERRYRDLFENANEPIATLDLNGRFMDVNAAFATALGRERGELLGTTLRDCLTGEGRARLARFEDEVLAQAFTFELGFAASDGREVVFEVSTRLIEEGDQPVGIQAMCRDVTARKEAAEQLRRLSELNRYQARHDTLTGLPNRLAFHDEIQGSIMERGRGGPFAVVLLDLDRFKAVNDTLGHGAGDALLRELAATLSRVVEPPDFVARLGGDEFGVLLHSADDTERGWAESLARIKSVFERPQLVEGVPVVVEASIGIAVHPTHGHSVDELMRRADVAMYVAKTAGRGHAVYSVGEDRNDAGKLALLGELRRAISERELVLHYQPIVDQRMGRCAKVEALVRWEHPRLGLIPPGEFVPLAETTGLIRPLTAYVLGEAAGQCRKWAAEGFVLDLSVNLSTRNLADPALVPTVVRALEQHELDPRRLTLEITESAIMADPIGTKRVLTRLSELGVRLAIDDFGAGFTSLSHLGNLPIDELKVDRAFIKRMLAGVRDRAIVRSIIDLSHDLEFESVAEGVESPEILDELRRLGCDQVQGFYFARPLPPDGLVRWLVAEAEACATAA